MRSSPPCGSAIATACPLSRAAAAPASQRRLAARRGWAGDRAQPAQPHLATGSGDSASPSWSRASINLDVTKAAAPYGLYYRPRPLQPVDLHDRRQRGLQLGRRALPQVRHDQQPRARHQGRAARRRSRATGRREPGSRSGPDLAGFFVGREGLFGIALEITLRLMPKPGDVQARCWRPMSLVRRAGDAVAQVVASGLLPGALEIMDNLAIQAAEAGRPCRLPSDAAAPADRRTGGRERPGRGRVCASAAGDRGIGPLTCALPRMTPTAPASGRGARAPFRPWAASAPTTSCRTAWCRAAAWARRLATIERLSAKLRHPRGQCLSCRRRQPAPADPVRRPQARRTGARRGTGRRDPRHVHRPGRLDHRRARRGHGEAALHARHV